MKGRNNWPHESDIFLWNEITARRRHPVWPDWAIYLTLGNFLKTLATINLPKSSTFLSNFCKGVKIFNFSSEIIFGQLLWNLAIFFWSHWRHQNAAAAADGWMLYRPIYRSFVQIVWRQFLNQTCGQLDHWPILYTFYNRKFWHQSHNFCNYVVILTLEW